MILLRMQGGGVGVWKVGEVQVQSHHHRRRQKASLSGSVGKREVLKAALGEGKARECVRVLGCRGRRRLLRHCLLWIFRNRSPKQRGPR